MSRKTIAAGAEMSEECSTRRAASHIEQGLVGEKSEVSGCQGDVALGKRERVSNSGHHTRK